MTGPPSGVSILNVRHRSRVAAVSTATGPKRLLEAGLADALAASRLPVRVTEVVPPGDARGEVARSFLIADTIARHVRAALSRDRLVLVLSSSCHAGLGALSGITGSARGVVWLDCHGDFNTPETTESGLLDGTTLASITGRGWRRMSEGVAGFAPVPDENVVLVGVRALGGGEAEALAASGVTVISSEDAAARAPDALRALGERTEGVYVHIDLDVLDPSVGMANAFATEGGFSTEGLRGVLGSVLLRCPVRVLGLTAYDPATDPEGTVCEAALEIVKAIAQRLRS